MKDQTNLIIVIVAVVFMIGFTLAFALGARKPVVLPAPQPVPVNDVQPAEGAVVFANSLPNAGSGGSSAFGGGGSTRTPGAGGSRAAGAGGGRSGGGPKTVVSESAGQ